MFGPSGRSRNQRIQPATYIVACRCIMAAGLRVWPTAHIVAGRCADAHRRQGCQYGATKLLKLSYSMLLAFGPIWKGAARAGLVRGHRTSHAAPNRCATCAAVQVLTATIADGGVPRALSGSISFVPAACLSSLSLERELPSPAESATHGVPPSHELAKKCAMVRAALIDLAITS